MTGSDFTRLEDMSEVERRSWATLIVDVSVFIWFLNKMTTGGLSRPQLSTTDASDIVGIFIGAIIATIVLHAVIAGIFALRAGEDKGEKDERDITIERRGAAAAFWVLTVTINIIAITLLLEYAGADGANTNLDGYTPLYSFINPPAMVFALIVLSFVGDIVKNAVMVVSYRGA